MRSLRTAAAVGTGAVLALSVLAGCGGSGGSEGPAPTAGSATTTSPATTTDEPTTPVGATEPGGTGGDEPAFPLISGDPCASKVAITGAIEKSWDTEGAVSISDSGPAATYQSAQGATVLTVYAAGNGFEKSVIVAEGLQTYAAGAATAGLDVADDGSGATLDLDAAAGSGGDIHVTATFTC